MSECPNTIDVNGTKYVKVEQEKLALMTIGNNYFIRTVTHYQVGLYVGTIDGFAILDNSAWVADTGRWSECLKSGKLNEVEWIPNCRTRVNLGSVVDIYDWPNKLPTETK